MASTLLMNGALVRPSFNTTTKNQTFANDNTVGSYKRYKLGIGPLTRFGPSDFRGWIEAVQGSDATGSGGASGVTNTASWATATSPFQVWTMDAGAPNVLPPTLGSTPWNGEYNETSVFWNPYAGQWWIIAHGGNNSPNKREIHLLTSNAWNGTRTPSNGTTPIFDYTCAGTLSAGGVADCHTILRVTNGVPTLYAFFRLLNASGKTVLGFSKTTDVTTGLTGWTTPVKVLDIVAATWESSEVYGFEGFEDADGRLHGWYVGTDGTTAKLGYCYSDDWATASTPTFTKGANNPVRSGTGVTTDPDYGIGDSTSLIPEEDIVAVECEGANFTGSFPGNATLDGRVMFWIPRGRSQSYVYQRKGRCFTDRTNWENLVRASGSFGLSATTFGIYVEFKMPPCTTAITRTLYTEDGGVFNKNLQLYVDGNGHLVSIYQTTTASLTITGTTKVDDDQWHRALFVRTGASAFQAFVDTTSQGTSAASPSTSGAAQLSIGNFINGNSQGVVAPGASCQGSIRRVTVVTGYAFTTSDGTTLFNQGASPVAWSGSGTNALDWFNDADNSPSAAAITVTGATLVEANPAGSLTFPNSTLVAATNRAMERLGGRSLGSPHFPRVTR